MGMELFRQNKYLEQMLDSFTAAPSCPCIIMFYSELEYCSKVAL